MSSFIETIASGGYWRKKEDSPGHSFALPNGTPFKIALEGAASSKFFSGKCWNGYYVGDDERKFTSASEAVNSTRGISSNAFLYIHFQIQGKWKLADDLRKMQIMLIDEVEEEALQTAKRILQSSKLDLTKMDDVQITRAAAKLVIKKPAILQIARDTIGRISDIPDLDL